MYIKITFDEAENDGTFVMGCFGTFDLLSISLSSTIITVLGDSLFLIEESGT